MTMLHLRLNAGIDTLKHTSNTRKHNLRSRQELLQWQLKIVFAYGSDAVVCLYDGKENSCAIWTAQLPRLYAAEAGFPLSFPDGRSNSTYSDYLQMCQEQNYDMKSSQVLFPKHRNEAHDELSRYIKKGTSKQSVHFVKYMSIWQKRRLTSLQRNCKLSALKQNR